MPSMNRFYPSEDSGTKESPTIIRSVGDEKVILSGGISINGWKKQGKVWVADVPVFNGRPLDFRQLWVNGKRQFVPVMWRISKR